MGLQIVGPWQSDAVVLSIGAALEPLLPRLVPPMVEAASLLGHGASGVPADARTASYAVDCGSHGSRRGRPKPRKSWMLRVRLCKKPCARDGAPLQPSGEPTF